MKQGIVKSIAIAIQVAIIGFVRSFFYGETKDSILGYVDCLTDLPNRKAFERDKCAVYRGYSLVMVDIDNLKSINDKRGHCFGDKIIQRLASILTNAAGSGGRLYRFAGDEFICIIPRGKVKSFCSMIRSETKKQEYFTISQGVILHLDNGLIEDALIQADITMYKSKMRGKDQISIAPQFMVTKNESVPFSKKMWLDTLSADEEEKPCPPKPAPLLIEGISYG